jgi:hypothetical protein
VKVAATDLLGAARRRKRRTCVKLVRVSAELLPVVDFMLLISLLATVSTGWNSSSSDTPAKALPITRAPPCWLLSEFGAEVASTLGIGAAKLDAFIFYLVCC